MFEATGDYREDCINLIAKMPHLAACVINHHADWGVTPEPQSKIGYMENFAHMLKVPKANKKELIPAFKLFKILDYHQREGNLLQVVGKAVASGLADMYGRICLGHVRSSRSPPWQGQRRSFLICRRCPRRGRRGFTAAQVEQLIVIA